MNTKRLILCIVLLLGVLTAWSKAPKDTVRILAIGNSFSRDAIEKNLYDLAHADGIPVIIGNAYIGGCSLERHANNARTDAPAYSYRKIGADGVKTVQKDSRLREIITDEDWDYISFQQASPLSGLPDTYFPFLPELCDYVRSLAPADAQFIIHQTWAYAKDSRHDGFKTYGQDQMKMYESIVLAYANAAKLVGIKTIIPCGTAIQNARTSIIGDRMTRDGFHLNELWGRYTAACTWYEKIFGGVLGNEYAPEGLSDDMKEACQRSARAAVKHPKKVTEIKF